MDVDLAQSVRLILDDAARDRTEAWRRRQASLGEFRERKQQARDAGLRVRHQLRIARQRQPSD